MSRKSYSFPEMLSDEFDVSCNINTTPRTRSRPKSAVRLSENTLERPFSSREIIITENNNKSDDVAFELSDDDSDSSSSPAEKEMVIVESSQAAEPVAPKARARRKEITIEELKTNKKQEKVKEESLPEDQNNNMEAKSGRRRRFAPNVPANTTSSPTTAGYSSPEKEKPAYGVIATARSMLQSSSEGYTSRRQRALLGKECADEWERYTHLPGVKTIPAGTPEWKVALIQKKNRQHIQDYLNDLVLKQKAKSDEKVRLEELKREEEKWSTVPEWMRPLMREKERKRQQERRPKKVTSTRNEGRQRLAAATVLRPRLELFEKMQNEKKEEETFHTLPPWRQELLLRKKEKSRLDSLPQWQKELVVKKRVSGVKKSFESENSKRT